MTESLCPCGLPAAPDHMLCPSHLRTATLIGEGLCWCGECPRSRPEDGLWGRRICDLHLRWLRDQGVLRWEPACSAAVWCLARPGVDGLCVEHQWEVCNG